MVICKEKECKKRASFNNKNEKKPFYCAKHAKEDMVDITHKKCLEEGCNSGPSYNKAGEKIALYCAKHAKEDMVDITHKRCLEEGCNSIPSYNKVGEKTALYCKKHAKEDMINIKNKKCKVKKCKNFSTHGHNNKKSIYCQDHAEKDMINIEENNKCSKCENNYDFEIKGIKLCLKHCPKKYEIALKRLCKYCDIEEQSDFVCKECVQNSHKKELSVVRFLRKNIRTPFIHDSNRMLNCSKRRPDVFFDLEKYCVIVEIDEHQHRAYEDLCECARINEIINGIGGRPVVIIRFNYDKTRNKKKLIKFTMKEKLELLLKILKEELVKEHNSFKINLIQLFYDDNYEEYKKIKIEDITSLVCI